jgi:uncharacterized SAM-binding protein YcdF (DUF218 family)
MYILAAKVAWTVLQPSNLIAFVLLIGLILTVFHRKGANKWLVSGTVLLILGGFLPAGKMLMRPLENRFPPLARKLPVHVDGVIILGGSENPALSATRQQINLNDRSERLIYGAILARHYPEARIVHSGGGGLPGEMVESDVAKAFFSQIGLTGDRFIYENRSHNSFENAVLTKNLVKPKGDEVWILVTSAFHMPRAMGAFRKTGWQVTAFPVDYYTLGNPEYVSDPAISKRLSELDLGVHEWVGLITYRLLGKSDSFFPGP